MNERKADTGEESNSESPCRESKGLAQVGIEFEDDPEDFGDDTELVPLTDELETMQESLIPSHSSGRRFVVEEANRSTQQVTSNIVAKFLYRHADWGYVTGTHNVYLLTNKHQEPEVSFLGTRCVSDADGDLRPYDDGAVPDVVIQFSWRNKQGYEEEAIDEMMNDGVEIERGPVSATCPRLGYLIKVRFKKKRKLANAMKGSKTQDMGGLDVYRLPLGTTVDNAIIGTGGASKFAYVPGGPDQHIDITPQDLGFNPPVAWNGFQIQLSRIFDELDKYNKRRQQNLLATWSLAGAPSENK